MSPWILLLAAASLGPSPADSVHSAYTSLDLERGCTVLDRTPPGEPGSWLRMVCQGFRGYPIFYSEGDLRVSLHYGFPDADEGRSAWESFASFNHVGSTVEWRWRATETSDRPFAAIHRWYVYSGTADGGTDQREVLVVSRVAQPDGGRACVVGYVDAGANPGANELAREVADEMARDFQCGKDEPRYHGETTEASPQPSRSGP